MLTALVEQPKSLLSPSRRGDPFLWKEGCAIRPGTTNRQTRSAASSVSCSTIFSSWTPAATIAVLLPGLLLRARPPLPPLTTPPLSANLTLTRHPKKTTTQFNQPPLIPTHNSSCINYPQNL